MKNTVLIIDDETCVRELIRDVLEAAGCRVLEADCAGAAAEVMSEQVPELILLDYLLPGMSGLQFLNAILRSPKTAAIPVILMSGLGSSPPGLGSAAGYLSKPFSPAQLLLKVEEALARPPAPDPELQCFRHIALSAGGHA